MKNHYFSFLTPLTIAVLMALPARGAESWPNSPWGETLPPEDLPEVLEQEPPPQPLAQFQPPPPPQKYPHPQCLSHCP